MEWGDPVVAGSRVPEMQKHEVRTVRIAFIAHYEDSLLNRRLCTGCAQ